MKLIAPAFLLVVWLATAWGQQAPLVSGGTVMTPGLVRWASGSSTQTGAIAGGGSARSYTFRLPEPTLSGNTVVLCVVSDDSVNAPSVADDAPGGSNAWTDVVTATDSTNHMKVHLWVAENVKAGTRTITPAFTAPYPQRVAVTGAEFHNVVPASAVDVTTTNVSASGSSSMSAGSMTTTQNGDLIYQCGVRGQNPIQNVINPYAAGSGMSLLASDNWDGLVSQWGVQSNASSMTPTITMNSASGYASAAMALKASASEQGSPRSATMQIVGIQHINIASSTATAQGALGTSRYQLANYGNLVVASIGPGNDTHSITAITDTNSRSWTSTGAVLGNGNAGKSQKFYLANATPTNYLGITATWSSCGGTSTNNCAQTIMFYDIAGTATSPFTNHYSSTNVSGGAVPPGNSYRAFSNVAPGATSGIGFAQMSVAWSTVCGTFSAALNSPSGGLCDSYNFGIPQNGGTGNGNETIDGPEPVDQNNGWGHFTFSTNANQTWTWPIQVDSAPGGIDYYASTLDFFAAAPSAAPPPPTNLTATVN